MEQYKVKDIRDEFKSLLDAEEFVIDKSGVKTIEIVGAQFIADEESIFGEVNHDWNKRELAWYKTHSLNVNDIPAPIPKIWQQVADPDGRINSNYGWCIWSKENYNQYHKVVFELQSNPFSRRAQMIYTRPSIWLEYNKNGMSDFICTTAVQYLIRDKKLVAYVTMRSNDAVFGYKGDFAWQTHIHKLLAAALGVDCGELIWNVASLHIYSSHFHLVK